jgi:hypothetical protein
MQPPLQHWHSAPYETLEGYRLEVDAKRMKTEQHGPAPFDVKADFSCMDPLTELQVCPMPSMVCLDSYPVSEICTPVVGSLLFGLILHGKIIWICTFCCERHGMRVQNAYLGGYDIGLPQDFTSQGDLLNDLLKQRQFQSSPNLQEGSVFAVEDSPDVLQQGTGEHAARAFALLPLLPCLFSC